ncbi:hypothetical protein ACFQH6_15750 [Halobacteriaceae archaeon GCM10025711]
MAQEPSEWPAGSMPAATTEWIEAQAAERGVPPEEFAGQLLAAVHAVAEDGDGDAPAMAADLAAVEREFDEKIRDVRERVVQVKRETDGKAPADHDHPEVRQQAERALDAAQGVSEDLRELRTATESLQEDLDAGFDNFEEVLDYLLSASDDAARKLDTVARALVDVRSSVQTLAGHHESRVAVADLAEAANRAGVRRAVCEDCGGTVDVALLTSPACPHCDRTFVDVEPKRGFFGSHTLVCGDPPALEAGTEKPEVDVEKLLEDPGTRRERPDVPDREGPSEPEKGTPGVDD